MPNESPAAERSPPRAMWTAWLALGVCAAFNAGFWWLVQGRVFYEGFGGLVLPVAWLLLMLCIQLPLAGVALGFTWGNTSLRAAPVTAAFALLLGVHAWVLVDYIGVDRLAWHALQDGLFPRDAALHAALAADPADINAVAELLAAGADPNAPRIGAPLWKAAEHNNPGQRQQLLTLLLEHGARPDTRSFNHPHLPLDGPLERVLRLRDTRTTLLCQLAAGQLLGDSPPADFLDILFSANPAPDQRCARQQNQPVLRLAIERHQSGVGQRLVDRGATLTPQQLGDLARDRMVFAAAEGDDDLLALLQRLPLNPEVRTWGLEAALVSCNDTAVSSLLASGTRPPPNAVYLLLKHCDGSRHLLQAAVAAGASPATPDTYGETPLTLAMKRRDIDLIETLVALGADPNRGGGRESLLHGTLGLPSAERAAFATRLLALGADPNRLNSAGRTFLMHAAQRNDAALVALALQHGADPGAQTSRGETAIDFARRHGTHAAEVLALLGATPEESKPKPYRLVYAAQADDLDKLQALVASGADIHARFGRATPLEAALRANRIDNARALIAAGADIEAPVTDGSSLVSAGRGQTAARLQMMRKLPRGADPTLPLLAAAAITSNAQTSGVLITAGADVNARAVHGETVIQLAALAHRNQGAITRTLLAAGADPLLTDPRGYNALTYAASQRGVDMLVALIEAGHDPNRPDAAGRTVIGETLRAGSVLEHLQVLVAHGVRATPEDLAYARQRSSRQVAALLEP